MQRKACGFYRLCANELTQKAILIRGAKNLLNAIDFPKTNYSYVIGKSTESFTILGPFKSFPKNKPYDWFSSSCVTL